METLTIAGTPKTPTVEMNVDSGVVEIKGRSIPENSIDFSMILLNSGKMWLREYSSSNW